MLDEQEFLSDYGIRALSKYHGDHPYIFEVNGSQYQVSYEPAESPNGLFGGNSSRPVYGNHNRFSQDPHWRDLILFFEYFHGEQGLGLGASHQTCWTGLVLGF